MIRDSTAGRVLAVLAVLIVASATIGAGIALADEHRAEVPEDQVELDAWTYSSEDSTAHDNLTVDETVDDPANDSYAVAEIVAADLNESETTNATIQFFIVDEDNVSDTDAEVYEAELEANETFEEEMLLYENDELPQNWTVDVSLHADAEEDVDETDIFLDDEGLGGVFPGMDDATLMGGLIAMIVLLGALAYYSREQ